MELQRVKKGTVKSEGGGAWQGEAVREGRKEWQRGIERGREEGRGKRSMQEESKGRCEKVE